MPWPPGRLPGSDGGRPPCCSVPYANVCWPTRVGVYKQDIPAENQPKGIPQRRRQHELQYQSRRQTAIWLLHKLTYQAVAQHHNLNDFTTGITLDGNVDTRWESYCTSLLNSLPGRSSLNFKAKRGKRLAEHFLKIWEHEPAGSGLAMFPAHGRNERGCHRAPIEDFQKQFVAAVSCGHAPRCGRCRAALIGRRVARDGLLPGRINEMPEAMKLKESILVSQFRPNDPNFLSKRSVLAHHRPARDESGGGSARNERSEPFCPWSRALRVR